MTSGRTSLCSPDEKGAILRRERLCHSQPLPHHRMAQSPRRGRYDDAGRSADLGSAAQARQRSRRTDPAARGERQVTQGPGEEGRSTGGAGKNARALGDALRGRGLTGVLEPALDEAFAGPEPKVSTTAACALIGRWRATHYRRLNPRAQPEPMLWASPPSALSTDERPAALALLNRPEYRDLPPAQAWARELG